MKIWCRTDSNTLIDLNSFRMFHIQQYMKQWVLVGEIEKNSQHVIARYESQEVAESALDEIEALVCGLDDDMEEEINGYAHD